MTIKKGDKVKLMIKPNQFLGIGMICDVVEIRTPQTYMWNGKVMEESFEETIRVGQWDRDGAGGRTFFDAWVKESDIEILEGMHEKHHNPRI